MTTRVKLLAVALSALLPLEGAIPIEVGPPPSIVRITLPPDGGEARPFTVPTAPEDTLEMDFPWPVEDWAGRGFTPDPEKYAGDFVVEASRGRTRMFVTPVSENAHRVLHVVLMTADGHSRSVPIELVPAPPGSAWHTVVFVVDTPAAHERGAVSLESKAPRARLRGASPESEIGLIGTLRLMLNSTAKDALQVAAANPKLELAIPEAKPRSFGDFTITNRYALRDATTGSLGLCLSISNQTARRLVFDPESWLVRAGSRVFAVRTIDFQDELGPGETAAAFLVVTEAPGLLADNAFEVSAVLAASVSARPVSRLAVGGLEP
ncbi:MAG TPA: hypothetical protein VFE25_07720 [Opitutaceae bacterium]|jgi:hypothetical protein|nr:hypothetical protein [Opitutaceae bacterium]